MRPLDVALTGAAGRARYQRVVPTATGEPTDTIKRPAGPDGTVSLAGGADGRALTCTTRFQGRLPPDGGPASLEGGQQWQTRTRLGNPSRVCAMTLRRLTTPAGTDASARPR